MRYEKGSFVVIPNKQHLKGCPAGMQAVYFWLCEHANEKGQCFPSRKVLAEESGLKLRTLDKYIKLLINKKLVEVAVRLDEDTNGQTSNLYQILIIDSEEISKNNIRPRAKNNTTLSTKNSTPPLAKNSTLTISNINYNQLTEKSSLLEALKKNKGLIKQKIRVQYINNDMLATEEEVEEVMDTIVRACKEQTPQEFKNTLTMYGLA